MRIYRIRTGAVLLALPVLVLSLSGCITSTGEKLTEGMVKMHIKKGCTTKAEVLEAFGKPEIITHKDDLQLWVYERTMIQREFTGAYINVLVAGSKSTRDRSASTSTVLYLYFDDDDVVVNYRHNEAKF